MGNFSDFFAQSVRFGQTPGVMLRLPTTAAGEPDCEPPLPRIESLQASPRTESLLTVPENNIVGGLKRCLIEPTHDKTRQPQHLEIICVGLLCPNSRSRASNPQQSFAGTPHSILPSRPY
jgi:hypothetical protein